MNMCDDQSTNEEKTKETIEILPLVLDGSFDPASLKRIGKVKSELMCNYMYLLMGVDGPCSVSVVVSTALTEMA
jgi:hypothetical protein